MWKYLAIVLLAASTFGVRGGSTLCFAAEDATTKEVASPEAKPAQPSQRMMHREQKANTNEQRNSDTDQNTAQDQDTAPDEAPAQSQPEDTPNPSQRSMRQQMKDAQHNQAPVTGNH